MSIPSNRTGCLVFTVIAVLCTHMLNAADTRPDVNVSGVLAVDYVGYDRRNVRDSGFRYDRAVIRIEGQVGPLLRWRIAPDLLGIDTRYGLEEAWVSFERDTRLRATLGLIKIPMGVETTLPLEELPFVGYAFPAFLDGRTDIALELDGEFREGFLSYDLAATLGEGFDPNGQARNEPQFSAKLVAYPWRGSEYTISVLGFELPVLSGFFAGVGYSYTPTYDGELDVANSLRNKLFDTPDMEAGSSHYLHFSWGLDAGPVRLLHEFFRNGSILDLELEDGTETDLEDQIGGWAASASWMLTGETYDSRPFRQRNGKSGPFPAKPMYQHGDRSKGLGALELAFRYANADIDRDFFLLGFTDFETSSQEFRTAEGAVNWYLSEQLRLSFQVVRTIADQRPAVFDSHGRDTSYVVRAQFRF